MNDRDFNLKVAKACDIRVVPIEDVYRGFELPPCIGVDEDHELDLFTESGDNIEWNPVEDWNQAINNVISAMRRWGCRVDLYWLDVNTIAIEYESGKHLTRRFDDTPRVICECAVKIREHWQDEIEK